MAYANRAPFPILGILGITFITLKLAGIGTVASWSWLWVLAPFWAPFALILVILTVAGILLASGWVISKIIEAYDQRQEAKANVRTPGAKE